MLSLRLGYAIMKSVRGDDGQQIWLSVKGLGPQPTKNYPDYGKDLTILSVSTLLVP